MITPLPVVVAAETTAIALAGALEDGDFLGREGVQARIVQARQNGVDPAQQDQPDLTGGGSGNTGGGN